MPHVIVEGPASVEQLYQEFQPLSVEIQGAILKIREMFLSANKMKALLECVVVEDNVPHSFYVGVIQKSSGITVHLDPLTDPEKTDGVRRLLALIGYQLKSQHPECRYGKHNLTGFLLNS